MQAQRVTLSFAVQLLIGCQVFVARDGFPEFVIDQDTAHEQNLAPGDVITIRVASDEGWVERQNAAQAEAEAAEKLTEQQRAADASTAAFQSDPSTGQTLAEGLKAAEASQPDVDASAGDTVVDTGATRTRSTRKESTT